MNSRHLRTLGRIFAEPTPADLRWGDIEALLRAVRHFLVAAGVRPEKE
jgi:hypothetical protein